MKVRNETPGLRSGASDNLIKIYEPSEIVMDSNKPLHKSYGISESAIDGYQKRAAAVYFRVDEGGPHAGL
jgi:hypothetical protein